MYHYYPTRQPVLVRDSELRIERRLPAPGEVTAQVGERVEPGTIVAVGEGAGRTVTLDVAGELGVGPERAGALLVREVGGAVTAGETIARRRQLLRARAVTSPVAGTLAGFDRATGVATIVPNRERIELTAAVAGVVEALRRPYGVTIRTFGARFYGAFGVGDAAFGVLNVVGEDREQPLAAGAIDGRAAGTVLAAGGPADAAALRKAARAGAVGVIVGSIAEGELRDFLQVGNQGLWRVGLPDWRLPAATTPLTIVVTEGFGRRPMAAPLYDALVAAGGGPVALRGATSLIRPLSRPEVLLPAGVRHERDESEPPIAALVPGATVRIVDQERLGTVGTVHDAPRRRRIAGDLVVEALEVDLPDGARLLLPVANVEVLT